MIDLNVLGKGKEYIELKQSFVIFICTFAPFPGSDRKMYTFTNLCHEQSGLELGDEAVKIFSRSHRLSQVVPMSRDFFVRQGKVLEVVATLRREHFDVA